MITLNRTLLSVVGFLVALQSSATSFIWEGLNFMVIDEEARTCKTGDNLNASGDIIIPEVAYDGDTAYQVTEVGASSFASCSGITSIIIPGSVKKIGNYAFQNCTNLRAIELNEGLETIGDYAFASQIKKVGDTETPNKVSTVCIPNTVTDMGSYTFNNNTNLKSVKLGSSLLRVGSGAFQNCRIEGMIVIPPNVKEILPFAFNACKINKVYIGCGIKSIYSNVFMDNKSFTGLSLAAEIPPVLNMSTDYWQSFPFITTSGTYPYVEVPATSVSAYSNHSASDSFSGSWSELIRKSNTKVYGFTNENEIVIDQSEKYVSPGEVFALNAQIGRGVNASVMNTLFWQSTNPKIATVDLNGNVTVQNNADGQVDKACTIKAISMYANVPPAECSLRLETTTGISNIQNVSNISEIYSLHGVKLSGNFSDLPAGIYIIKKNGQTFKIIK